MKKIPEKELLHSIRDKAKELGRTPRLDELYHRRSIQDHFGSYNNALKKLNIPYNRIPYPTELTKKEYKRIIVEWATKNKRVPTTTDFSNEKKLPSPYLICKKFNMGWTELMTKLGYETRKNYVNTRMMPDKEIIELFKKEYFRIKPKSLLEFNKKRRKNIPNAISILKRLNTTWNELLLKIGVDKNTLRIRDYTDEELFKIIRDLYKILGKSPSKEDLRKHGIINPCTLARRFGSFTNAIKRAGVGSPWEKIDEVKESNEELLEMYIQFSKRISKDIHGASNYDLNNSDDIYNYSVFALRFGGMYELKKKAGFIPFKNRNKFTKRQLMKILIKEYGRSSKRPTNEQINKNKNIPSLCTFLKYFKTTAMNEVWEEIERG